MDFTDAELETLKELVSACYFDVDDTLQPMGTHKEDSYFRGIKRWRALVRLSKEGRFPPICLVSGRGDAYLESFAFTLGDQTQDLPRISEGGALIKRRGGRPERNPAITQEALEALQEVRMRIPRILEACPGFYRYEGKLYCETFEREPNAPMGIEEACEKIEKVLTDLLPQGVMVGNSSIAVDVVLATKLMAILQLCKLEGWDKQRILFGGDSKSDVESIRFALFGVAPTTHSTEIAEALCEKSSHGASPQDSLGSCTEETAEVFVTFLKQHIRMFVLTGKT